MDELLPDSRDVNERGFRTPDDMERELTIPSPCWGGRGSRGRSDDFNQNDFLGAESCVGFQPVGAVGRAVQAQIILSDSQGPPIVHVGLSAAAVSFPP